MKKRRKINRNTPLMQTWIILMAIFIMELFFYTWCRVQCVRIGYEITKTSDQRQHLVTLQKNLKIELARLKSPERITKIAIEQLDLAMPDSGKMIVIP